MMNLEYSNSWALIAGINRYQDKNIPDLHYAEADAKALATKIAELGFPSENIRLMLGSKETVTRDRIFDVMESEMNPNMKEDDRFLFYFSGHGARYKTKHQERGYILMADTHLNEAWLTRSHSDLQKNPSRALEMNSFLEQVRALPAKHKLLLLDSCFSGFLAKAKGLPTGPAMDIRKRLRQWMNEPVTQVLTAGRSGQQSFEKGGYGQGVFTHYLLKGLEGYADPRGDGIISFLDLANYICDRVSQESAVEQVPQIGRFDGEGQFFFQYQSEQNTLHENESKIEDSGSADDGKRDMTVKPGTKTYKAAFREHEGKYIGAAGGGGGMLMAVSNNVKEWETFEVEELGGGKITLRAHNGQYISAEGGGGGKLKADATFPGGFETFQLIDLGSGKVALKTQNDFYVSAQPGDGRELIADRTIMRDREVFEMVKL